MWGLRWECKAIALFEYGNIINILFASIADFQKIRFQKRNAIRQKLRQWPMQIAAERCIQRVLENVCQLSGYLGESREAIAGRSTAQRVRRNVKPVQILVPRVDVLKHTDVFPQILQV